MIFHFPMEKSLGKLKDLNLYDTFTFANGRNTYCVVKKEGHTVFYRMISRSYRGSGKDALAWQDQNYKDKPKHRLMETYSIHGDIEVFDFLPF